MDKTNPKRENLLNLALDATRRELGQSWQLRMGFDEEQGSWELIVRTSSELDALRRELPEIAFVELLGGYGVATVPEYLLETFTNRIEIEYIEKPKRLFFAVDQGKRASCVYGLPGDMSGGRTRLTGRGVLCGIADSGIDWRHPDFLKEDGTTRIRALWDQTLEPVPELGLLPPSGYDRGVEFLAGQINEALADPLAFEGMGPQRSIDGSGHGTHVAGIMAGNGRAMGGRYRGVAYESDLLVVRLGRPREDGFPSTVELLMAVDYMMRKARELGLPIAVNLSFGNNYGSHSGTSLLETYLDGLSGYWKNVIVVGTGNEGASSIHTSGTVSAQNESGDNLAELAVSPYESSLSVQIWVSYMDALDMSLIHPSGQVVTIPSVLGPQRFRLGATEILLYYGEPSPYSTDQEIYLELLPQDRYIDSGIWGISFIPGQLVTGRYDMWLPGAGSLNRGTGFLYPTENTTLTIPSTADKVISVAAYDSRRNQAADFSGRGYTRRTNQIKPDLAAPGVDIVSAAPGGGYTARTGTSMATPFVTGSAALLMQWGIVNGNSPYLYGEKVKAFLLRGARPLPGIPTYPNEEIGWGVLCLRDSFP